MRGGAQIIQICTVADLPGLDRAAAQNGGDARSVVASVGYGAYAR